MWLSCLGLLKSTKKNRTNQRDETEQHCPSIHSRYIRGGNGFFSKYNIPVYLRPGKSLRDWATERGKTPQHRIMLFMSSVAVNNVQICTLTTLNSQCTDAWHNTGGPVPLDKIQPSCYSERLRHSFEDSNVHVLDRRKMVGKTRERSRLC